MELLVENGAEIALGRYICRASATASTLLDPGALRMGAAGHYGG
ncbi:hypothetical protein ACWEKU_12810 [Streptomyces californicus]